MAKPRVTATDRLSNVMDVVALGRRTGLLSAERDVGTRLEEAEIYFVSGNAIYATLGPLRGHDALDALAQWNSCRFCFDPQAPQPIPNVSGVLPAVDPSSPSGYSYAYVPASSNYGSSFGGNTTDPNRSSGTRSYSGQSYAGQSNPISRASWNSPPSGYPSGSLGDRRDGNPSASSPGHLGGIAGGDPGASNARWGTSGVNFGNAAGTSTPRTSWAAGSNPVRASSNPAMSGPTDARGQAQLQRRPHRAPDVRDLITVVTTYNLSRAHRTILLLADGEHSVLDLSRLSGKPIDEVTTLLGELEGRGLIYYAQ